jgi:broad specificity phosphatase PhoE
MEWYKHDYFKGLPFEKGMQRIYKAVDEFLLSLGYQHDREKGCYRKVGKTPEKVALFAHGGAGFMILSAILNLPYPYVATHLAHLSTTGVAVIGFGTGVGGDEGDIYPQLFQYNNDSHLYKEDLMTEQSNVMKI